MISAILRSSATASRSLRRHICRNAVVAVAALLLTTGDAVAEMLVAGEVVLADGPDLPPGALVDVLIEDQSRADVAATVVARSQSVATGPPPYPFRLSTDLSELDPQRRYGLRVRISAQGELWYINTDRVPITADAGDAPIVVEVEPVGVATDAGIALFTPLPALFTGTALCPDCRTSGAPQTEHLLELDRQGRFVYQREPIPLTAGPPEAEIGRWSFDPDTRELRLEGASPDPRRFVVDNSHLLRRPASDGSGQPLELNRAAACTALEPTLTLDAVLDTSEGAPILTTCLSGEVIPIAADTQWTALEQAYLDGLSAQGLEPGSALLVSVEATLAQRPRADAPGVARHAVIERVLDVGPERQCPPER